MTGTETGCSFGGTSEGPGATRCRPDERFEITITNVPGTPAFSDRATISPDHPYTKLVPHGQYLVVETENPNYDTAPGRTATVDVPSGGWTFVNTGRTLPPP